MFGSRKKKNSKPVSIQKEVVGRRQMLKVLAAVGGMITTIALWGNNSSARELMPQEQTDSTPSQIPFNPAKNLTVEAAWQNIGTEDIHFLVEFSDGTVNFGRSQPKLQGHNKLKSITLTVLASKTGQGICKLFLFNPTNTSIPVDVTVTAEAGSTSLSVVLGTKYPDDERYLADVSFSEGLIREKSGPFPYPLLDKHLSLEHL